jgi:hypothetical protein
MTGGWGVNIGAFMRHYDGWLIRGLPTGFGNQGDPRSIRCSRRRP